MVDGNRTGWARLDTVKLMTTPLYQDEVEANACTT